MTLPFIHTNAPVYLAGIARPGPTTRDNRAVTAMARLLLHPYIPNIQTSWVKLGTEGAAEMLRSGANDLGGTLMEETISRMAGSSYGSYRSIRDLPGHRRGGGPPARPRTTLYGEVPAERLRAARPPTASSRSCCRWCEGRFGAGCGLRCRTRASVPGGAPSVPDGRLPCPAVASVTGGGPPHPTNGWFGPARPGPARPAGPGPWGQIRPDRTWPNRTCLVRSGPVPSGPDLADSPSDRSGAGPLECCAGRAGERGTGVARESGGHGNVAAASGGEGGSAAATAIWGRAEQQDFRSRVRGCLLGGAIGDALGAGVEFDSLAQIRDKYGQQGVTDYVPAYGRAGRSPTTPR